MACRRAFTLIELLVVIAIIALLISILLPALGAAKKAAWKVKSLSNIRQIMIGTETYRLDNKQMYPLIPSFVIPRYRPPISVSQVTGYKRPGVTTPWCSWSAWGKNTSAYWRTFGYSFPPFDWEAADRQANRYISDNEGALAAPAAPTMLAANAPERKLEQFIYRDPADNVSYLQGGQSDSRPDFNKLPQALGISTYDDVGTSYLWNWKWWEGKAFRTRYPAGSDSDYHAFKFGCEQLRDANSFSTGRMVIVNDQYSEVVPLNKNIKGLQIKNGYGEVNKSMMGFADGHTAYLPVVGGDDSPDSLNQSLYSFTLEFLGSK